MGHAKKITWLLLALTAILLIINTYTAITINSLTGEVKANAEELARPANIQVTTISDASCSDCFDISTVIDALKAENVNIKEETNLDYTSEEAQSLLEKYDINKVPALIVTGEINKEGAQITGLEEKEDALIFANPDPVYLEIDTGEYRGRVQIKEIINPNCEECYDTSKFIEALKKGIVVSGEETLNLDDANQEIEDYSLTELPAIILSGDLAAYPKIKTSLEALGEYTGEDLVLTAKLNPPYWDLETGEAKGLVSLTYITDESCSTCYDVNIHKKVLENYGVYIADETTLDIATDEGRSLLEQYDITAVPTIILSPDLKYYTQITKVWEQVGTVEDDGSYVFRNVSIVSANYTDLSK